MAKLEKTITGDFNGILRRIEDGILNGSVSASLEESSDFRMVGILAANQYRIHKCVHQSGTAIVPSEGRNDGICLKSSMMYTFRAG